ncbi:hypothetical protein B0H67DRAFT_598333 [Lasiosphaeris hirsuta]|uniref:Zn(2)-C6 fungal-type domain-containing protein n=1 Tax=Lasiosphaeris hirsuta TaxID=260670 RepID=A0AA40AZK0_9PEZI|nr:hypothetical protein B0H67DRAFT_598333 [Lasiosphaeris hirsuta]
MARRTHTKSRYGCAECKRRHIKCDESRPICVNCSVGKIRCSFSLTSSPALSLPMQSRPAPSPSVSRSRSPSSSHDISSVASPSPPHDGPPQSLLLRHFENQMGNTMGLSQLESSPMLRLAVDEAFTSPFLMDELLALSAAHKSTLPDTQHRDFYRTEATRLQTRALAQFNMAEADVSDDNCVAVFLFSTFIGQHVLFDTFSPHSEQDSLGALLDKFVQCLGLHRGIAAIAGRSWPKLQARMPPEFGHARFAAEWPVRQSAEYVSLLSQKRPEALVVLAYYSVLLHRARDHWLVGGAGRFLIQAIGEHLGSSWADWLAWPNRNIDFSDTTSTSPLRLPDGAELSMVDHGWT